MHQWVLLLAVLAALQLPCIQGAKPSSDGAAPQLYAAVNKQQRVQLGAGSKAVLNYGPLVIKQPLVLLGAAGNPATISCSRDGPNAMLVRATTLELHHVIIAGCSKHAIILEGPGAVLKASGVTFRDHGSAEAAAVPASGQPTLGLVISATDARVELTNVTITGNSGARFSRNPTVPAWRPYLHPACRDSSESGGVGNLSNSSDGDTHLAHARQQACGSPLLGSSLMDLEQSTLVLKGGLVNDNMADALISARGSSQHSLQLLPGTKLQANRARWLVVADSWTHDPMGRKHMKAPQPSEAEKGVSMVPPYTSYALMGRLRASLALDQSRKLLQQDEQQEQQEQRQPLLTPDAVVGKAPEGQVPLQVRFQGVLISHNIVQSGLLWLRLVNTSMQDTDIMYNIGTGGRSSIARQLRSLVAAGPSKVAAAAAKAEQLLWNTTDQSSIAVQAAAGGPIVPPGPCDVGSLQRSLLIMHGPSAFDMNRCRISHNIHFSGAVLRVTEGLGPTSLRNSHFVNNTATAVLRFEGRTWVLNTETFFAGIQFLDVLFYTQFQGASQAAYKFAELQHAQQQASKDKVSYDAFWFMLNTSMVDNTVFHSLVMSKGSRTSWRAFLAQKADILQSGKPDATTQAKKLPLINLSTSWWMRGCTLRSNRLMLPPGSTTASSTSNAGPFSSKNSSPARSTEVRRPAADVGAEPPIPAAPDNSSALAADGDFVVWSPYVNEWLTAVPYAAYSDVLSAVLDADENLLLKLSQGGQACYDSLRLAVDEQQAQLTLQVMLRATAPAVLWGSTTQAYIEESSIIGNEGFFHTLRMDNAYVTWRNVSLTNNKAALSVFDLWFGDAWVDGARVVGNQVQAGSIWNFESFRGRFQQILLAENKAGTARPSDLAGWVPEDPSCNKQPRPAKRGGRAASTATPSSVSEGDGSSSGGSSSVSLSPIWRMSHFLGELHQASIVNNTGSLALDISGMALSAPLTELLVADNMASGIRLLLPEPKYDNQSIELYDVFVLRNSLSPAAPLVGGLLIGGFTSGVGATMPVAIGNSVFVNNTPAQPMDTLTLQGGGVCLQGPAADSADDPMSQHGFLQKLSITMTRTTIEGNHAAEGGGLWTAWPMIIEECSFKNNHAVVSGGGIYAKGLQQDSLGAFGALIINHTTITDNTASFGGGIACDGCRAIVAAEIDGNQAIRNISMDAAAGPSSSLANGSGPWGGSNGGGSSPWSGSNGNGNGGSGCGGSAGGNGNASSLRKLRHAVLGAGGGIAANLAGNSYVVICASGNGSNINERGRSSLRNNTAWALGGAVYLNSTMIAADCPFPQPGRALTETCFPGGFWPTKCGFNTLDLDWRGSRAWAGGDLVAWAGDVSGFNMACTLHGSVCDNATLGNSNSTTRKAQTMARAGKAKGSTKCKGWDCKKGRSGNHNGTTSQHTTCVKSFDAQSPLVCAAGSGLGGRNVMLVDDSRKFQLPASFSVYNTTCIKEARNTSRGWQSCAVAGDLPHTVPRVFSGDTVNLTVSLGTTQQHLHPRLRNEEAVIGTVQLQQSPEGLFVIGDTRQQMQMGLAEFNNMALQPVSPPISNKDYEFRFSPAWGPGNDLLRQVKPVTVLVKLMRCTLGMHMTINRCVRCSANGTYSLNPFTNETIGCQPCPNGGLCQNGLLVPRSGYYSYNPFVPQVLPCPLKGACTGKRAGRGLSPAAVQELQRLSLGVSGPAEAALKPRPSTAWSRYGLEPDWVSTGRRLTQVSGDPLGSEGDSGDAAEALLTSGRLTQHRKASSGQGPDSTDSEGDQQHQQQAHHELVVSRRQALMGYNNLLAQLWANDSTDGIPLLQGVKYKGLLDAWHRLQCNPGYTGMFCGRCDLNYVEGSVLVDSYVLDSNETLPQGDRYGLHMGSCVPCQSPAVIALAVFALFLLLFAYNAFGMCMQLRNSGIRDPYVRFIRSLQAQQSGQLQPQGSGQTGSRPATHSSTGQLARNSGSSHASHIQQQQLLPQASSNHMSNSSQQQGPIGHCYSVHSVFSSQPSYGFAIPFAAIGPNAPPLTPGPVGQLAHIQGSVPSPQNPCASQALMRSSTMPSSLAGQGFAQSIVHTVHRQSSGAGTLSPTPSMASPFMQQADLPPLLAMLPTAQPRQQAPAASQQQQQPAAGSPMHQQQAPVGLGNTGSSSAAQQPVQAARGGALPRANTMPHSFVAQSNPTWVQGPANNSVPAAGATGSSFVFAGQQGGQPDQQQPRDQQQRQQSLQGQWWGSSHAPGPQRQQSLPQQQQQQQHQGAYPTVLGNPQQSGLPPLPPNLRQRHPSVPLNSVSSGVVQQGSTPSSHGQSQARPSTSRGNTSHMRNISSGGSSSSSGSSSGGQQRQQQQQAGFRKGPAGLLVGLWKVLTSYLQVLGTVRHVSLRGLPEMSNQALAFADLSSFTSFVALDCLLPGPQEWHAFIKLFARTIALPALLLLASALMWTCCWIFRHLAVRVHRRYGLRHTRWQPLQRIQRQAAVVPDPLMAYLSPRMLITLVVLSYSLYPLVTSGLLYTLQCVYIPGPFAGESAAVEYSRRHYDWLLQRAAAANSSSNSLATGSEGSAGSSDIQLCRPGKGALEGGLCWLTGRYWAMDYDVQCFEGHHRPVAQFGMAMLVLLGVVCPLLAALWLWLKRQHLDDWEFAWKWSFLYAEYKPQKCFWEFVIMGRKLVFLAATILLPMALDTPEETTAQMQLLVCVMLAIFFLLLHASQHPFKRDVLNRLERLGLTAIALSCTVLAASLVVEKGRLALLAMLAVINIVVVSIFLFHIIKQMWLWVGAPAKRAVVTAYRNSRVWWTQHVTAKLLPCLRRFGCNCVMWCTSCCGRKSQGSQPGSQQDSQADAQQQGLQQLADGQQQADGQSGNAGQQRRQKPVPQQAATGHHLQAADSQQLQQASVQPPAQQQQQQQQLIQQIQLVRR